MGSGLCDDMSSGEASKKLGVGLLIREEIVSRYAYGLTFAVNTILACGRSWKPH